MLHILNKIKLCLQDSHTDIMSIRVRSGRMNLRFKKEDKWRLYCLVAQNDRNIFVVGWFGGSWSIYTIQQLINQVLGFLLSKPFIVSIKWNATQTPPEVMMEMDTTILFTGSILLCHQSFRFIHRLVQWCLPKKRRKPMNLIPALLLKFQADSRRTLWVSLLTKIRDFFTRNISISKRKNYFASHTHNQSRKIWANTGIWPSGSWWSRLRVGVRGYQWCQSWVFCIPKKETIQLSYISRWDKEDLKCDFLRRRKVSIHFLRYFLSDKAKMQ